MLLEASELTRRAAERTLLNAVSLQLCGGERIGLVGATGSGKSLLLRTLAMLEPLDSGCLRWQSKTVTHDRASHYRSQVIYVHQRAARFEGSVGTVLSMPFQLAVHRRHRFDRDWIVKQLATVGRDASFLDQPHDQLSGGESQIVALLRAVQLSPQVLLLDEPTSALDVQSAAYIESIVSQWYEAAPDSRAFLWVSHDRQQAERVGQTLIKMESGRLEMQGDVC